MTLERLNDFLPIHDFRFGHTPWQIRYFQVSSQKGSREFEYYQHVLQLRQLQRSLMESEIREAELNADLKTCLPWWRWWTRRRDRVRQIRLQWELMLLRRERRTLEGETERHFAVIDSDYADLVAKTEDEILAHESEYWQVRLKRQALASRLTVQTGIGQGDVIAITSLPIEVQNAILACVEKPESLNPGV